MLFIHNPSTGRCLRRAGRRLLAASTSQHTGERRDWFSASVFGSSRNSELRPRPYSTPRTDHGRCVHLQPFVWLNSSFCFCSAGIGPTEV